MTKPTKWHVHPAKTQISLGIRPVWSESSLSTWRKLRSLATHWMHSEDSDQTWEIHRLIWVCWAHMPFCWFCWEVAQICIRHPFNLQHSVGNSCHGRGVGYFRSLSGSVDILHTHSQKVLLCRREQEVLLCRREFALPWLDNAPWNIQVLAFTPRKYDTKLPSLRCQHCSTPPQLVWTQFLGYRPTSPKSAPMIKVKEHLGNPTMFSVSFWTAYTVCRSPITFYFL